MTAVPIVLVGGGLGAGKTSLLRAVMASPQLPRIGLVVNEFGDLDVDGALLAQSGSPVVTLPNGCVCCAAGGELAAAVARLLRDRAELDALVVELSGVADPYPVLQELRLLGPAVRLAKVIAVVDLDRPTSAAAGDPVLLRLLSVADTVVLNKRDLVTAERLAAWRDLAGAGNPRAQVHVAERGNVALAAVLHGSRAEPAAAGPGRAAHAAFHTTTVAVPAGLPRERLRAALAPPFDVERVKGFVRLAEGAFLVQVVRGHVTFEALATSPPEAALNKLVLIGADLERLQAQAAALW
jgi:G3E family GTPase